MPSSTVRAQSKSATPLLCLSLAGVLWGAGGLVGALLGQASGATPLSVAAFRLLAGGGLLIAFRMVARQRWPRGRAAWRRITVTGLLSASFQAAYFCSIALSSVSLATLITIGGVPVIVSAAQIAAGRERPPAPAWSRWRWPWPASACWSACRAAGTAGQRCWPARAWPWHRRRASRP